MDTEAIFNRFSALLDTRDQRIYDAIAQAKAASGDPETLHKLDTTVSNTVDALAAIRSEWEKLKPRVTTKTAALWAEPEPATVADLLLLNKAFRERPSELRRGQQFDIQLQTKDITGIGRGIPFAAPGIAPGPRQTLRVRGLLPSSTLSTGGAVLYTREASFTNAADAVLEGALKPKSDKTFQTVTVPIETIAHWIKVSKQSYADAAGLAQEINSNLIYGLELKLEQQLLKGTGTAPQIRGMYPLATPVATAPVGATIIDALFLAVSELTVRGYNASGIVLSPADYTAMQLLKDTTGRYLLGSAVPLPPIVASPYLAAGEWLVGDFTQTHLYIREEMNVQVSNSNEDDFIHNLLSVLAEIRSALVVYQPAALLKNPAAGVQADAETSRKAGR